MAHEIYRHGFASELTPSEPGVSSSIKLFLSHAKAGETGCLHAKSIYDFINKTNMSKFFDAYDISPSFKFDEEIIKHIKESTLIAIGSDLYSARYWCQREILCAKEHQRPMIFVDCLKEYEDRIFPAGANVPCVHISPEPPINEKDILRILVSAIIETIRYNFAKKSLIFYQNQNWIKKDCAVISTPPEIRQVIRYCKQGIKSICYPEPPIYIEEADWHEFFNIETFTPLWNPNEDSALSKTKVGISISNNPTTGYSLHHLHEDQLKRLSQDLARHILARSGTVVYGGDLRNDGFTQFILDEAIALKSRLCSDNIHVENHLAWPLYVSSAEINAWRAKYNEVIKTVEHVIPKDIESVTQSNTFIPPNNTENSYIWSRCLTEMRESSIKISDARICAGGKLSGYSGKMPGVLEEIMISIKSKKPIYLLGAFGGIVSEVCKTIESGKIQPPITEEWQITNHAGYKDLQEKAKVDGHHADYKEIEKTLKNLSLDTLAKTVLQKYSNT